MDTESNGSQNVAIAFGLVLGAGGATFIGASVVFFPGLVRLASRKTLAAALGLSAGVMIYVSVVEILFKSIGSFVDAEYSEGTAYMLGTVCFFSGVAIMKILGWVVHKILNRNGNGGHSHEPGIEHGVDAIENQGKGCFGRSTTNTGNVSTEQEQKDEVNDAVSPQYHDDPAGQLESIQQMATSVEENPESQEALGNVEQERKNAAKQAENRKLIQMSLNTALAIGIHNFPEGLATFVAALNDPAVGAVLAIAIAIHNIPEGLCVAMPVYYGTGNKLKAFFWAGISGISEPIAAVLGYVVLANSFSDTLYGVLFGLVSGMMVIISVKELLPTAHRYDPSDDYTTDAFIVGMAIMALSLVLFNMG